MPLKKEVRCKVCENLLWRIEKLEDEVAEVKRRYEYVAYPWPQSKQSSNAAHRTIQISNPAATNVPIRLRTYDGRYPGVGVFTK